MKSKFKIIMILFILFVLTAFITIGTRQEILQEQLDLFSEFYAMMDKNYADTINLPDLMKKSINKTIGELDIYASYHETEEAKKWNDGWKGVLWAGIGSSVKQSDSGVVIEYPYRNMPAMLAGLHTGDLIKEINSRNVLKMELDSVVKLLRGNDGDSIYLTVKKPYIKELKYIGLKRKNVLEDALPLFFMINDSTGYIELNKFNRGTANLFKNILTTLKTSGMKRLVLDLRYNNGGLVDECTSCLSAFLPFNSIVCNVHSKDTTNDYVFKTLEQPIDILMPIILLTANHTISSGEIFSGCLKDYKRAVLIGEKTYGKGFVQSTHYFKNGAILYLTTGRYYTPLGNYVGKKGVEPDIKVRTSDSLEPHLKAVFNSGIIADYCIVYRNTKQGNDTTLNGVDLLKDFKSFYLKHVEYIKLPEDDLVEKLRGYHAAADLEREIISIKKDLPAIYRNQLEIELQKELLKQNYQYMAAGKLDFVNSGIYKYLIQNGF